MTLRDFILPLTNGGEGFISDWYQAHVRLCESFGNRVENEEVKYLFCDEPTLPVRGMALRIRAICPDIAKTLSDMGLPEATVPTASVGDRIEIALNMSGRIDARNPEYSMRMRDGEKIVTALEKAGLTDLDIIGNVSSRTFRIYKGKNTPFGIPGHQARVTVTVKDEARFQKAIQSGIGRDKGLGFGMIVKAGGMI